MCIQDNGLQSLYSVSRGCPCGYFTDPSRTCRCNSTKIAQYLGKISGPLLDRIDIHLHVPQVKYREFAEPSDAESSSAIKARVSFARSIQQERFAGSGVTSNAQMTGRQIKKYCTLGPDAQGLLKMAMTELELSARAYDKILRVSRTIADLAGGELIEPEHIAEAIQYRSLDRNVWA